MNRLSRLNFIALRDAAASAPPPASKPPSKKDDPAIDLVNQSVLMFFPSDVRKQMEEAAEGKISTIKFMGKDFKDKEILRLSNAIKGTLLSFYLNLEMKREMEELSKDQTLLESILEDDDEEGESWKKCMH